MTKRQRRKVGNVLEIKVQDNLYSYAIEINEDGYVAFFDYFVNLSEKYNLNNLLSSKIIYKFIISDYLIKKNHFKIIDNIDISKLDTSLKQEYIKDIPTGKYRIYNWPDKDIPTTEEYVIKHGLAPVIIFDGEEQIQRLLFSLYEKKPSITLQTEPWLDPYSEFNQKQTKEK